MVYQISAFLENRAGQFAEITTILAENGIDLRAISIAETADYGILRMIVDNAKKTTSILMQHGYLLTMTPVLVVAVAAGKDSEGKARDRAPRLLSYTERSSAPLPKAPRGTRHPFSQSNARQTPLRARAKYRTRQPPQSD